MAPPKQIQCTGCGKLLNNGRGYANHKRTCRQQQAEAAVRLDLYRQNMEKRAHAAEEAHRAWIREQAESSYGEHGDASGIGEDTTMVEPIEVCCPYSYNFCDEKSLPMSRLNLSFLLHEPLDFPLAGLVFQHAIRMLLLLLGLGAVLVIRLM